MNLEEKPETIDIEKKNSGSYYNEPEYRIDRESLPADVQKLLDHLDEIDKDASDTKKKINGIMFSYFSSGGSMQSYSTGSITCRGYIKPLLLNLSNKVNDG